MPILATLLGELGELKPKEVFFRAHSLLVTGDGTPREKFQAWAETVPYTLRNPIHHWTHIELQRCFDIDLMLTPNTADEIWERTNARLAEADFSTHGLLKKFDVRVVGTTDDPADPLADHHAIAASDLKTLVVPTFRPDKALLVDRPELLNPWLEKLEAASDMAIVHLSDLLAALTTDRDLVDAQTRASNVADENSRLASLGYENGAGSLIAVIDAQRQAQRTRLASIEAQALLRADMAALFVATAADWRGAGK